MSTQINTVARITREDLPGSPDWVEPLLESQNGINEQVIASINGTSAQATVSHAITHQTELVVKNPLPSGARAGGAWVINSDGLPVATNPIVRNINTTGVPQLGITLNFAPPAGMLRLLKDASQSIPNGTGADVNWQTQDYIGGTALSHSVSVNNTRITCNEAGIVEVTPTIVFFGDPTGGRFSVVYKNGSSIGSGARYGVDFRTAVSGSNTGFTYSAFVDVVANDYIVVDANQTSGAALAILGNVTNDCHVVARYVSPPIGYTAKVKLIIFGE